MTSTPLIAVTINVAELADFALWRQIPAGLQAAGAIPLLIDCGSSVHDIAATLKHVDGLLISGGGDVDPARYGGDPLDPTLGGVNPIRDANEVSAFTAAWARQIPILAVCRGLQLVNVACGGTLVADLARDRPSALDHRPGEHRLTELAHRVTVAPVSRIAGWIGTSGEIEVNSQHHQGVDVLGSDLIATAHAADGLTEAFESTTGSLTAVQWHPEINWQQDHLASRLMSGFVASCRASTPSDALAHRGQLLVDS